MLLALAVVAGFAFVCYRLVAPAHDGADPNAYLVAAKQLARTGAARLDSDDPFRFAGRMWVVAGEESDPHLQPKYPPGFSLLTAAAIKYVPARFQPAAAYWVAPACMTLGLLGAFFLFRALAGSFGGILGLIALATSPATLTLAVTPNSHGPALMLVAWGMFFLLRWFSSGGALRALLAGLLLGLAVSARLAEGLLLLPILLTCLFRLTRRLPPDEYLSVYSHPSHFRRTCLETLMLLAWWGTPVALLLAWNLKTLGTFTGYDGTSESLPGSAFTLEHLWHNWAVLLRHLHDTALILVLPLSLLGLVLLTVRHTRLAAILLAWILPAFLLHAAYYWGPDQEATPVAYVRLLHSVLPALVVSAVWMLPRLRVKSEPDAHERPDAVPHPRLPATVAALAAGGLVAAAAAVGLRQALPMLVEDHQRRLALAGDTQLIQYLIPRSARPPLVLTEERSLANHLQFATDLILYDLGEFDRRYPAARQPAAPRPSSLDPARLRLLDAHVEELRERKRLYPASSVAPEQLAEELNATIEDERHELVTRAMAQGRRVFLIQRTTRPQGAPLVPDPEAYDSRVIAAWRSPSTPEARLIPSTLEDGITLGPATAPSTRWQASWQIVELMRKGTRPLPASEPASRPAP